MKSTNGWAYFVCACCACVCVRLCVFLSWSHTNKHVFRMSRHKTPMYNAWIYRVRVFRCVDFSRRIISRKIRENIPKTSRTIPEQILTSSRKVSKNHWKVPRLISVYCKTIHIMHRVEFQNRPWNPRELAWEPAWNPCWPRVEPAWNAGWIFEIRRNEYLLGIEAA